MMKLNILNWFRIINWQELNFQYRLVEVSVEGAPDDPKELHKAFYTAMNYLAHATRGPVAEGYHAGKKYIAVRADADLQEMSIPGTPLNIKLSPIAGKFYLNPAAMDDRNLELALKFLENTVNWQFCNHSALWEGGQFTFLKKSPVPAEGLCETDVYPGFKFRLVAENKTRVYFCVDLAFKYADKRTLAEQLISLPPERHGEFINNRNFLYLNGDDWYVVKGKSVGKPISEHMISTGRGNSTVYDYIVREGKYSKGRHKLPLAPHTPTFFHAYTSNAEKVFAGAAALAKRVRMPEDEMHKYSINAPNRRFTNAEWFIKKYFQDLTFNGVRLQIDSRPLRKMCKSFRLPGLVYGGGALLDPYRGSRYEGYGRPLDDFPRRRRSFIYQHGIVNNTTFTSQHVFFPDNMDLEFGRAVKKSFEEGMKKLAPNFPGATLHEYKMKSAPYAHMVFADLKEYIEKRGLKDSSILFILPAYMEDGGRFVRDLHHLVKKELFDTAKIKCISGTKLLEYFKAGVEIRKPLVYSVPPQFSKSYRSYFLNTLFECLIINRKWAFKLADRLHNDIYIGIDAHEFYAGFCFFFGDGEKIVFDVDETTKGVGTFRNEKINFKTISDKIVDVLSRYLEIADERPHRIIILRDGVSYGEEQKALDHALARLHEKQLIDKTQVKTGVVNVAKSSAIPLRAASFQDGGQSLVNPDCGTYLLMNSREAFVFNTGYPYTVPGSSNPLHVSWVSGQIDFEKTLEDIFQLTQIAFSAPDRPSSLPLPLKLIDVLIRDVAHENDLVTVKHKESTLGNPMIKNKSYERL